MKKTIKIITSFMLILFLSTSIFAFSSNSGQGKGYGKNQGGQVYTVYDDTQVDHQIQIDSYPMEELSQEEIQGLLLMREEEKLARDVYLALYDVWGQQIFSNIASSEETHTNAVKSLLDKYNIEDPMNNDIRGVFENQDLEDLYNQLVEQGSTSLVNALTVGATVEDLDIKDLEELLSATDNQDITAVYNNLLKGSRNHLRSFVKLLEGNGGIYESQFISEDEYNLILSGNMETGTQYDSQGTQTQVNSQNKNSNSGQTGVTQINTDNTQGNQAQSQNMFAKMWRGVKSWF